MSVLSLASVLDDPARQIPVPLIMRTAAPTLAQDGVNVGNIRSQHFAQREQIRRLARMGEDAYAVDIESGALASLAGGGHPQGGRSAVRYSVMRMWSS